MEIERLAAGGDGVGRLPDGRTVFVPLSAAGDRALVRVVDERRRHARAELVELLRSGPGRAEPRCSVFGSCGGCCWQHLDYAVQLGAKRSILRDALRRIGGFELPADLPMVASPKAYGYRQRARVLVEGQRVGYRARRSHELCALPGRCPVLLPELEAGLEQLLDRASSEGASSADAQSEWQIAVGSGELQLAPLGSESDPAGESVVMCVGQDRLQFSAGVFAQANALLVGEMVAAVKRAVLAPFEREQGGGAPVDVLELYAGAGSLTIGLARAVRRVEAVEANPAAAKDLVANLHRAGLDNVDVRCESSEKRIESLSGAAPDAIVLDPPRAGLGPAVAARLAEVRARRVVYLSCDPATLARDLAVLAERGYGLEAVQGFDLFPQTAHVEALAVMRDERPEAS